MLGVDALQRLIVGAEINPVVCSAVDRSRVSWECWAR